MDWKSGGLGALGAGVAVIPVGERLDESEAHAGTGKVKEAPEISTTESNVMR